MVAVALSEPDGLAGSLAKVIQFCPPCSSASDGPDIGNIGRMKREDPFDSLVTNHSPYGERLVDTAALAGNYRTGKYLGADFITFLDPAMDVYYITYLEMRYMFF